MHEPDNVVPLRLRAWLELRAGQPGVALAVAQRALEKVKNDPEMVKARIDAREALAAWLRAP
jgi:hypothetical protein